MRFVRLLVLAAISTHGSLALGGEPTSAQLDGLDAWFSKHRADAPKVEQSPGAPWGQTDTAQIVWLVSSLVLANSFREQIAELRRRATEWLARPKASDAVESEPGAPGAPRPRTLGVGVWWFSSETGATA